LKFFELQHVGDLDGAKLTDLSEIIAEEIGDHDKFGSFLFGTLEVESGLGIEFRISEAGARALDRPGFDFATGDPQKGLRGRRKNLAPGKIQIGGGWCGSGSTKVSVQREESAGGLAVGAEAAGEIDLVDITRRNVILNRFDSRDEVRPFHGVIPISDGEIGAGKGAIKSGREIAGFPPLAGLVVIDEEFGIDSEGVLAVVVDPTASCPDGKTKILIDRALPASEGGMKGVRCANVTAENLNRASSDDGDGRGVIGGEVADSVEENESRKVGEATRHIIGFRSKGSGPRSEGGRRCHDKDGPVDMSGATD